MRIRIAIIPGDGVGKEIIREAVKVCRTLNDLEIADLELTHFDYGAEEYLKTGITLPDEVIDEFCKHYDALLVGPIGDPRIPHQEYRAGFLPKLCDRLKLSVHYHPVKLLHPSLYPFLSGVQEEMHWIFVSENIEGIHSDIGGYLRSELTDEIVFQQMANRMSTTQLVVKFAFQSAAALQTKKILFADKPDTFRYVHSHWIRAIRELDDQYPEIALHQMDVDTLSYSLLRKSHKKELIIIPSYYSGVVSHIAAGIHGGLGMTACAELNPGGIGLFRPLHGPVARFAGKNVINPFGAILAVQLLLQYSGRPKAGRLLEDAIRYCIEHELTTRDLDGSLGTEEVGDYLCQTIEKLYQQQKA